MYSLELYILFSGNIDYNVVLVRTVEDGGVLKLHTE